MPPVTPRWFLVAAALGLLWNIFGVVQFAGAVRSTSDSLMEMGLSAEQAHVMTSYPSWMTAAFALGVFGGLLGSALLLLRTRRATPVLAASLLGYLVLYAGDITEGVFAALGAQQVAILTTVVAIAAALFALSWHGQRRAILS